MANMLWGQVYYQDQFAGVLRQEAGDRVSFTYDEVYIASGGAAIAFTLPLQQEPFVQLQGLPAFFDNLVAEGWLEQAQTRLLGKRIVSRFELLLAYGYDCAGAVSIVDPEPASITEGLLDHSDPKEMAVLTNRASLSGVQPKLAVVERDGKFFPSQFKELSSFIAKFPSSHHDDLVCNEYLTMLGYQALLPNDQVAQLQLGEIEGISAQALIISRFDREDGRRVHFEEFNQLLGNSSQMKYEGAYQDMATFIADSKHCLPAENYRLFQRILAGLLLGNTDMHFKNFAMFHTPEGLRLTPSYDQVAAMLYQYKSVALAIGGASNLHIGHLKSKHIVILGREFGLSNDAIHMAVKQLEKNRQSSMQHIAEAAIGSQQLKNQITQLMEARWNGLYTSIGKALLKKP